MWHGGAKLFKLLLVTSEDTKVVRVVTKALVHLANHANSSKCCGVKREDNVL
jgi:hypothetical protein